MDSTNSTCYWKVDEITEKDASTVSFFTYFLIFFGVITAF